MPKQLSKVLGVNYHTDKPAFAYIRDMEWKIKPLAHTKKVLDIVINAIDEYETSMRQLVAGDILEAQRLRIYESATKTILDATLEKFNYTRAANDPRAGPGLLGKLAMEVKDFLANGAKDGMLQLETQLALMNGASQRTSQD